MVMLLENARLGVSKLAEEYPISKLLYQMKTVILDAIPDLNFLWNFQLEFPVKICHMSYRHNVRMVVQSNG